MRRGRERRRMKTKGRGRRRMRRGRGRRRTKTKRRRRRRKEDNSTVLLTDRSYHKRHTSDVLHSAIKPKVSHPPHHLH